MIEIKDLLARFDHILLKEEGKKEVVRKIISEVVGIDVKRDDVEIRNGTLYLNIKPIYKNEIFLKKELLASRLEETFGAKTPDIR
jgi:hypothetical protein